MKNLSIYFLIFLYFIPLQIFAGLLNFDLYEQKIIIELNQNIDNEKIQIDLTPLFNDYEIAISTRWDDNNLDSLKVRELLEKYGFKGTFFLNATDGWYSPVKSDINFSLEPKEYFSKELLKGGNSIGCHTLNHRYLTYLSRNNIFYEILGCRIDREVNSQSPVNTFGFPYTAFASRMEGDEQLRDIIEIINRSGVLHIAEDGFNQRYKTDFSDVTFITIDNNQSPDKKLQQEIERANSRNTLYVIGMHAWVDKWGKNFLYLEKSLKKLSNKKNWWYCNQNEYGAYRYQFFNTKIEKNIKENQIELIIKRPFLTDLNSDIPLTIKIKGLNDSVIKDILCNSAKFEKKLNTKKEILINLWHDNKFSLPSCYGAVNNFANLKIKDNLLKSKEVPEVSSLLYFKDKKIFLILKNDSKEKLEDIRILFRLPLKWNTRKSKMEILELNPDETKTIEIELTEINNDFLYAAGNFYFVAQIDFKVNNTFKRLYSICIAKSDEKDYTYPYNGFFILGPLPQDNKNFNFVEFVDKITSEAKIKDCYYIFNDEKECFKDFSSEKKEQLSPNIIFTTGKDASVTFYSWDKSLFYPYGEQLIYCLWGIIESENDIKVKAIYEKDCFKYFFVNNKISNEEFYLKKGENDIKIFYYPHSPYSGLFDETYLGAFFKIIDENGNRIKKIRYKKPPILNIKEEKVEISKQKIKIDDFESSNEIENLLGGKWLTWTKSGCSIKTERVKGIKGNCIKVTADITGEKWTPAIFSTNFLNNGDAIDLRKFVGLKLYMKGKKGTGTPVDFVIQIISNNIKDYSYWKFTYKPDIDWQCFYIPWQMFERPVWGMGSQMDLNDILKNATGLQFSIIDTSGIAAGSFGNEWYFDEIEFFTEEE